MKRTLVDLLRSRAADAADRTEYLFLANGEVESERLSAAALDARARAIAARLAETAAAGDRALLLFPPGLDFIAAFFGCLYAGVIAVPAYPPRPGRGGERLAAIAGSCRPAAVLTTAELLGRLRAGATDAAGLAAARWLAVDAVATEAGELWRDPGVGPETAAFLQYTSGSTAEPKGVVVTHGNLLHNERMIQEGFGQSAASVIVGWLPLHHDMGLIGNVLQPLYCGARCILMSPLAFLQRPEVWLRAISRYRATTSGGPNFAYELCLRKVGEAARAELDLASWSVAYNGAEPVRAETLERFAAAFAPAGFRRAAFYPCYGLAEATLYVTGGEVGTAPPIRAFDGRPLVGCGTARLGQSVRIVDPESRRPAAPGEIGEIWVAGPSVAQGYWGLPEASAAVFGAHIAGEDPALPFLRTGDLGFLDAGELFVTGRLKELIILRGRNHYPQDIEITALASHGALRPGGAAAFAVEAAGEGGGEELVVAVEIERRREPEAAAAAAAVRRAVAEEHEVAVREV
ncbi:MAG: hypothetical protein QOJ16_1136, partial [Acidobacteriota bacterium]|nr:hypothetical protein [Acidobacteriota bacterium]